MPCPSREGPGCPRDLPADSLWVHERPGSQPQCALGHRALTIPVMLSRECVKNAVLGSITQEIRTSPGCRNRSTFHVFLLHEGRERTPWRPPFNRDRRAVDLAAGCRRRVDSTSVTSTLRRSRRSSPCRHRCQQGGGPGRRAARPDGCEGRVAASMPGPRSGRRWPRRRRTARCRRNGRGPDPKTRGQLFKRARGGVERRTTTFDHARTAVLSVRLGRLTDRCHSARAASMECRG